MEARRTSGIAIASMVLGILSLVFCWAPFFGVIMGIVAVVFGGVGTSRTGKDPNLGGRGMAIAGLVCGIIGIAIWVIFLILAFTVWGWGWWLFS